MRWPPVSTAFLAALLAYGCTSSGGATRFEHLDECPNPVMERMSWVAIEGTVVEVTDARAFRMRTPDGRIVNVAIANLAEQASPGAPGKDLGRELLRAGVTSFVPAGLHDLGLLGMSESNRGARGESETVGHLGDCPVAVTARKELVASRSN